MKVATIDDDGLDGRLALVSDDLTGFRMGSAGTLQKALDTGDFSEMPDDYALDTDLCGAPLPRAFQFLDGSAYVNHVELVRKARGAEMPDRFWTDPLMYQGLSVFAGPNDPIRGQIDWGMDFEAEIAVITRKVPQGVSPEQAAGHVAFVMLLNDISLRNLIPDELSKGFGFVHSKPISACSPVAVRTRALPAGTVIGSGTISNKGADGSPGLPVAEGGAGYSCIAEQRMVETIISGKPATPFLQPGDRVRIWMEDADGNSIFGTIDQTFELWETT